jgi:hypothetical protein
MKRTSNSPTPAEIFVKAGLIAALAAVLLMPTTVKVASDELGRVVHRAPMLTGASWNSLPLPPIPHLATMPWLERESGAKRMKIDTWLAPKFELLGPAVGHTSCDEALSSLVRPSLVTTSEPSHRG